MTATTTQTKPATAEDFTALVLEHEQNRERLLADLAVLEGQAGAVMLDDPGMAQDLAERVASLRARADLEARAASEARKRAQDARVADLRAQADALTPAVEKARKALTEHDAKRDRLRRSLEDFTGLTWTAAPLEVGESARRGLAPREVLTFELDEVQRRQDQLRRHADAAAADPDWVHPQETEVARVTASWADAVETYRESAAALAEALTVVDAAAAARDCAREDVMEAPGGDYRSGQVHEACTAVARLEGVLRGFWDDVAYHRGQGLDLPADDVQALAVELGIEDE